MKLYIIRHADPNYEIDSITDTGKLEAHALAHRLEKEGITHIFTSPLGRAMDTMHYTAKRLNIPYEVEYWMKELSNLRVDDPLIGNINLWDISGEVVLSWYSSPKNRQLNWKSTPYFNNLYLHQVYENIKIASNEFISKQGYTWDNGLYKIKKSNKNRVAVFCHNGLALAWISYLLSIPLPLMWTGFFLFPSSVTTILFEERSSVNAVPRCLGLGDVSHLYKSSLLPLPRGIKANWE